MDYLLLDGSIERRYRDGTSERRTIAGPGRIQWSDNRGRSGVDINLGNGQIQRQFANGQSSFGQDLGNGITSWNGGQYLTINETPLPEQLPPPPEPTRGLGGLMVAMGLGWMFGLSAYANSPYGLDPNAPEYALFAEYEMQQEQLRRQQLTSSSSSSGDGGDSGDSDWSGDTSSSGADFGTDSFG
jgi:hypothetical protein